MGAAQYFWKQYLNLIDKSTYFLVVFQYFATLVFSFIPNQYLENTYFLVSNLFGYSVFTNSIICVKIWKSKLKHIEILKSMVISMICSNIFSMVALWTTREFYLNIFDRYFLISFTAIIYLYYAKKINLNFINPIK